MPAPHPAGTFLESLRNPRGSTAVELRPPRSGLTRAGAMDMWIDLAHTIRRLASFRASLLLTDSAVGEEEEENLQHLAANLAGEIDPRYVVPFLTCKHPLAYCLTYAERARARGLDSLSVIGGDPGGPPRSVAHSYQLRSEIRARVPELTLGGWVNPHADPNRQAQFVGDEKFGADYLLSQVVSHHDLSKVEAWLRAAEDHGITLPTSFGVFFYRNGHPETLTRLSAFFPVPVEQVGQEFESGTTAEEHCARTIAGLRSLGIRNTFVCNLGARTAGSRYERVLEEVDRLGA